MKVANSYASVIGGVSEQVPQDRREGQHQMQVNMVSDPVRGIARRHGSKLMEEAVLFNYDAGTWSNLVAGTANTKTFTFFVDGVEYDLIYRSTPDTFGLSFTGAFFAVRKIDGKIMDVDYSLSDPMMLALASNGVSAAVNVGRYVYLAANDHVSTYTGTDIWGGASNKRKLVAWVRGGAFKRKYSVTLTKADGTKVSASYTTVSAGYPGVLDTSDIVATDTEYQKKVNDRVNAYNSAVTAWITSSAADIATTNIAQELTDALVTLGVSATRVDSNVVIDDADFVEISCDDAGDQTLIRGVGNEVTAAELVSVTHYAGKVVKVRPKRSNGDDAYYLQAYAKDKLSTGWTEVYWLEAAGYVSNATSVVAMGTVAGDTLYLAGSAAGLTTLMGGDHPAFTPSAVGDLLTCPIPTFFGKSIDYLGVFQDRLVVGCGSTIFMSRSGDYFNFFRGSVLTVQDNDPIEMYALGSEGDTIVSSVTFDRNVILFGKRQQYSLNGRQTMTPVNASIVASSYYEDAVDSTPVASGNYVFYCNTRDTQTALFQVQIGLVADSPESYNLSGNLDTFLDGTPVEVATVTKPNTVFLRTSASRNSMYVYAYLDSPSGAERVFDAWSRWDWSPAVGYQVGMSRYDGNLYVYMIKEGKDASGSRKVWFSVEKFTLKSALSDYPYLDSLRIAGTTSTGYLNSTSASVGMFCVAFPKGGTLQFLGTKMADYPDFAAQYPSAPTAAYAGVSYNAYFTPTNPFVRDKNDKAVQNGRLTIMKFLIAIRDSGGLLITTMTSRGTTIVRNFNGRIVGDPSNATGQQPIVTTQISAVIGKETRDFSYSIFANTWLPLTVTAIEWSGQFFNNVKRV